MYNSSAAVRYHHAAIAPMALVTSEEVDMSGFPKFQGDNILKKGAWCVVRFGRRW